MPRSTYRYTVNKALAITGQPEIASDAEFDGSNLGKYQNLGKMFVDLVCRQFSLKFNKRFSQRKYELVTNDSSTEFDLNPSVTVEGITYQTFFNVTVSGTHNGRLSVMDYDEWQRNYPNPEQYARQAPNYWIAPPDDGELPQSIILWPYPDDVYTIRYQARLDAEPLTQASQLIIIPTKYEHIVWLKAKQYLESMLNEGKELNAEMVAMEAVDDVLRDAGGALENSAFLDLGVNLFGGVDNWGSRRDWIPTDEVS